MPAEPSTAAPSPNTPFKKEQTTQAAVAAAIVGLGALLPNPVGRAVAGMLAPFLAIGIVWLVNSWAEEWKAGAPRRRVEKYQKQIEKNLRRLPAGAPNRAQLAADHAEVGRWLHQHMMQGLEVVPQGPAAAPLASGAAARLPPAPAGPAPGAAPVPPPSA